MMSKWFAARSGAVLILVYSVLGSVAPLQAHAGSWSQEGTDSWGSFTIPAADVGQLELNPEPPRVSPQQQAMIEQASNFSHLPGPRTPTDPNATILDAPPELGPTSPASEFKALSPGSLTIFSNQTLSGATGIDATGQAVSPSAANNGRSILTTYNYYAALSTDYGTSWSYINSASVSPGGEGAHGGFAGDQDVIYDPSRDLMVWALRYIPNATGNQLRLVVLDGSSELQGDPVDYLAVTLTPEGKCAGTDTADWFDAPQLALTSNFLYVSANVFRYPANTFTCSIVMRIPLDNLDAGPYYDTTNNLYYSTPERTLTGAHGGTHTFYFAAHVDNNTLRIYDWPESAASVTSVDVDHASYLTGVVHDCTVTGTGVNPCAADGDGITDGWLRRDLNDLAFMWDVPQGTDGNGTFPYPYVRTLVVDATTKALVGDNYVWSSDGAFFLPSAAVNARGHVGGTYAFAGDTIGVGTGPYYPQCNVWLYDDVTTETFGDWTLADNAGVTAGTGNPTGNHWGDYLRTRVLSGLPHQFLGTCYAVEGGSVTPRIVRFGRERDATNPSTIGVYDASWYFLRNANSGGGADLTFQYGWNGPIPLVGDWDASGTRTVGLDSDSWFFLSNSNGAPVADLLFQYGWAGAVPLIGDWDGNGTETIAITDGGWYFLRNSNTPGSADQTFSFGWPTGTPIMGDWDGNGSTTVGMYEAGFFYLRNSNSSGPADLTFGFGPAGATPIVGDWDGNGSDTIGIKLGSTYYLRNSNTPGPADIVFSYGWDTATPLTGNWDGLP